MRALISFSSLLSATICRLLPPCRCGYRAFPFGWQLAPDGQREFYQCPAACSCGGQYAPVYRQIPVPGWCRLPTLPAKSPHFLYRSSRSYPPDDFSSRLSHPGYAVHFVVQLHGIVHTADRIAPLLGTGFF